MLIQNDWRHDTRVIREASALADRGFDVNVVCRQAIDAFRLESAGGVTYHCMPIGFDPRASTLGRVLARHAAVVRTGLRQSQAGIPRKLDLLARTLVALLALVPVALPLAVVETLQRRPTRLASKLAGWTDPLRRSVVALTQPFKYLNEFGLQGHGIVVDLDPDVIHAHDLVTLSTAVLSGAVLSAKVVYDAHELETHTNHHSLTRDTKRWIDRYERILIAEADSVITVCESIADWLRRHYAIERPLVVMNAPSSPPVDLAEEHRAGGVRAELGLPSVAQLAVYVGSVTIDRGLELCVRALEHLPGVHLATVGPRYAPTEKAMIEAAEAVGVLDRLHFVDPKPANEVVTFISSADCSVMAIQNICLSYYFCFPNKLLESVFAGLPVVVANLLELRRFVERYDVGVVVDETGAETIAAGIRRALTDGRLKPTAEKLLEIEALFGWPVQAERLAGLYAEVAAGCGG
jgi:glycosyltransferase involved in cell wall biosynthesis